MYPKRKSEEKNKQENPDVLSTQFNAASDKDNDPKNNDNRPLSLDISIHVGSTMKTSQHICLFSNPVSLTPNTRISFLG